MSPKESLRKDINDGLVTLLTHLENDFVIRYGGLKFVVKFDKAGEIVSFDSHDVGETNSSVERYLKSGGDVFIHHIVYLQNTMAFIYIEPINPRPWMLRNIASLEQLWWCIHRSFDVDVMTTPLLERVKLLSTTRVYTRKYDEEPVEVKTAQQEISINDFLVIETKLKS